MKALSELIQKDTYTPSTPALTPTDVQWREAVSWLLDLSDDYRELFIQAKDNPKAIRKFIADKYVGLLLKGNHKGFDTLIEVLEDKDKIVRRVRYFMFRDKDSVMRELMSDL